MNTYFQAASAVLLALILILTLNKQNKETATMLSIAVCIMVAVLAVSFLEPVIAFLEELCLLGELDEGILVIMLKVVGIGFIGQMATMVCDDAGNGALGKVMQLLTAAVILWLAIPVLQGLIDLVQEILEGV